MKKKLIVIVFAVPIIFMIVWLLTKYESGVSSIGGQYNQTISSEKPTQNDQVNNEKVPVTGVKVITAQDQVNQLFKKAIEQETGGYYEGAKISLNSALRLQPNDPFITSYYASLYFHIKDYENALIWINKALSYRPTDTNFWSIKIDILKAQSQNNQNIVESSYNDALIKTNNNINIITSYASWLGQIGRKQEAATLWQKAITIYPQNKSIYQAEINSL